jgi:tRNA nucleotidyltransferase (CCA-adding enzyme)
MTGEKGRYGGISIKDPKKYFFEFDQHLMEDTNPSYYFKDLMKTKMFPKGYPFIMLEKLVNVCQSPKHHPEGSVWNHTMMVLDQAAGNKVYSEEPRVFMWSALLHDLGKASTTRINKGRITSYDHDKVGEKLSERFLNEFTEDKAFIRKVAKLVRWHMQILYVLKDLPFANIEGMASDVSIYEVTLLALCDRLGRGNVTPEKEEEEKRNVKCFIKKCTDRLSLSEISQKSSKIKDHKLFY